MSIHSILSVPGTEPESMRSGFGSRADAVVLDLEGSIPADEKPTARQQVVAELDRRDPAKLCGVRVNGLDTEWGRNDVQAMLDAPTPPDYVELPDVRGPSEVETVAELLDGTAIEIMVLIEHPSAVFDADAIARASPRVFGITFGPGDYATAMGVSDSDTRTTATARSLVAMAGKANDLLTIDMPSFEATERDVVLDDTETGRQLGYDGKIALNELHVDVINAVYH